MKHFNKIILILIISLFIISGCFLSKSKVNHNNYWLFYTPPGTVKIQNNFFCDKEEIRNLDWMEYVFWTKEIYGSASDEYLEALPDTSVWNKFYICPHSTDLQYFNKPSFYSYPVVGISQKQAEKFSKWRSDRVFEEILINFRIIVWDTAQTKKTYFSVERYYNANLPSLITYEKIKYFPNYSIPTFNERKKVIHYSDSLEYSFYKNCKSKYCKEYKKNYPYLLADNNPCLNDTFNFPTNYTSQGYYSTKGEPIYHIRGNVSEWSAEKNISFGGSWYDPKERIIENDIFYTETVNARTGFRNVCSWTKWDKSIYE